MRNKKSTAIAWASILAALASAVGIFFLPDYRFWFLAILLLNFLIATVFNKNYHCILEHEGLRILHYSAWNK